MKALVSALTIVASLAGCSKKPAPDIIPDPQGWFIESYDDGVITVQHEGYTYEATCDSSRSLNNAGSISNKNNVVDFPTCGMAIGFVGHNVQPFEGKRKDADGRIINMWNVGSTLAL